MRQRTRSSADSIAANAQQKQEIATSIITWACAYAQAGYHVFPLLSRFISDRNKLGTPPGWGHNPSQSKNPIPSTLSLDDIVGWASHNDLVGYGIHPMRRSIVIDVDVKDGKKGLESFKALAEKYGIDTDTYRVRTRSGGYHYYFGYPDIPADTRIKNAVDLHGYSGIDIRSDGGFVVGPHSHSSSLYSVLSPGPVDQQLASTKQLPQEVIALILSAPSPTYTNDSGDVDRYDPSKDPSLIPEKIPAGGRDNTLLRLIAAWARRYPKAQALQLLEIAISRCEQPPGNEIKLADYIQMVDRTYSKPSFHNPAVDMVNNLLDRLVLIDSEETIVDTAVNDLQMISITAANLRFADWNFKTQATEDAKPKEINALKLWFKHSGKQMAHKSVYIPAAPRFVPNEHYNLYRPPLEGFVPQELGPQDQELVALFKHHIEVLWEDEANLAMEWCAHLVQHPDKKLAFAPVLISPIEGVGKDLLFQLMRMILGPMNVASVSLPLLLDSHNDFAANRQLVLINEIDVKSTDSRAKKERDRNMESLKSRITDHEITVNRKFQQAGTIQTYTNYILFSNHDDGIHITDRDRRYWVHITKAPLMGEDDPRIRLWSIPMQNNQQGAWAIRNYLQKIEITRVSQAMIAPRNESKQTVIEANKTMTEVTIETSITSGLSIFQGRLFSKNLFMWYLRCIIESETGFKFSEATMTSFFKQFCKPVYAKGTRSARQILARDVLDLTSKVSSLEMLPKTKIGLYCLHNDDHDWSNEIAEVVQEEYARGLTAVTYSNNQVHRLPAAKAQGQ